VKLSKILDSDVHCLWSGPGFCSTNTYIHTTKFIERQCRKERIGGDDAGWLGSESWLEKVWFKMALKCREIINKTNVCRWRIPDWWRRNRKGTWRKVQMIISSVNKEMRIWIRNVGLSNVISPYKNVTFILTLMFYILISFLWIVFTNQIKERLIRTTRSHIMRLLSYKPWFFLKKIRIISYCKFSVWRLVKPCHTWTLDRCVWSRQLPA